MIQKANQWIINKTFTIDMKNKIRMIGIPLSSPGMTELLFQICNEDEK